MHEYVIAGVGSWPRAIVALMRNYELGGWEFVAANLTAELALVADADLSNPIWENEMKRSLALPFAAAMFGALAGLYAAPAVADEFTPAQKAEIGAIMKDYLIHNPDALRAAIDALTSTTSKSRRKRVRMSSPRNRTLCSPRLTKPTSAILKATRRSSNFSTTIAIIAKALCPT